MLGDSNLPLHQAPQPRSCSAGACETCAQIGQSTVIRKSGQGSFLRLFAPRLCRRGLSETCAFTHKVGRPSLKRVPNSTAPVPVPFTSHLSPARKKHSQGKAQQRALVNARCQSRALSSFGGASLKRCARLFSRVRSSSGRSPIRNGSFGAPRHSRRLSLPLSRERCKTAKRATASLHSDPVMAAAW